MELETFQYTNNKGWSVKNFPKLDSKNTLILVFADPAYINESSPLQDLSKHYPNSLIIGCSSTEEITGSFILGGSISRVLISDQKIAVAVIHFQHTILRSFESEVNGESPVHIVKNVISQLDRPDLTVIFLISECKRAKFNAMLKFLNFKKNGKSLLSIFALADSGKNYESGWILSKDKIKKNALIALGFYGSHFHLEDSSHYRAIFHEDNINPILAISQINHNHLSQNDEYELENLMTYLPKQTQLIGFYSVEDDIFSQKKPKSIILFEEEPKIQQKMKQLEGVALAKKILSELKLKIVEMKRSKGIVPKLAAIYFKDNPSALSFLNNIKKSSNKIGIEVTCFAINNDTKEENLIALVKKLNKDKKINGIELILPLPKYLNPRKIAEFIAVEKDVDCTNPYNLGRIIQKNPSVQPCIAQAVMLLLNFTREKLEGKHAVVVGASHAGMPIAILLKYAKCTVTICDIHTLDLNHIVNQADILVTAVGKANLIKGDWIKKETLVIDAGCTTLSDGTLQGDVEFHTASKKAKWLSPIPRGTGPITVAILLRQTFEAAQKQLV